MRSLLTTAAALLLTTGFAQAQPDAVEICMFEEEDWQATFDARKDNAKFECRPEFRRDAP